MDTERTNGPSGQLLLQMLECENSVTKYICNQTSPCELCGHKSHPRNASLQANCSFTSPSSTGEVSGDSKFLTDNARPAMVFVLETRKWIVVRLMRQ